jgi:hypothetical protein
LRLPVIWLLGIALLNGACTIASYSPPIPEIQLPTSSTIKSGLFSFSYLDEVLSAHVADKGSQQTLPRSIRQIREVFEGNTRFEKVLVSATPPLKGLHVNIYQARHRTFSPLLIASILTIGIIPCYEESVVSTVHFDVLKDNILLKTYEEEIRGKRATWIGFLPFWWITFIVNTSEQEAFLATVHNFTKSARQDGLL